MALASPRDSSTDSVAGGNGGDRLRAALAGGDGGAPQPSMQDLVDAILQLGRLPSQSSRSSAEEKRLAARLIRARKAGTLSWQQEAHLRALQPATRVDHEDSGASAGASRQAQGSASAVRVDAGGGASQPAAAGSGASQPAAAAGAGEAGAEGAPALRLRSSLLCSELASMLAIIIAKLAYKRAWTEVPKHAYKRARLP